MMTLKISNDDASEALLSLTPAQRTTLADLIEAERQHATRWWTFLNEMRCRGELPDWIYRQLVGSCGDYDRCDKDREAVNRALFGKRKYIRHEESIVLQTVHFDSNKFATTTEHRT